MSSPEPNIGIKGQKMDMRGSTVNLRDAEGEITLSLSVNFTYLCVNSVKE